MATEESDANAPHNEQVETWEDVEARDLRPGDYVRALGYRRDEVAAEASDYVHREGEFTEAFESLGHNYVRIDGSGCDMRRRFQRRVGAPHTWVPVQSAELAVGDYARGTGLAGVPDVEGRVERITPMGYVKLDTSVGRLSPERHWFKRVGSPAEPTTPEPEHGWERIDPADITPGMWVRGTHIYRTTDHAGESPHVCEGEVASATRTIIRLAGAEHERWYYQPELRAWEQRVTTTPAVATAPAEPTPEPAGEWVRTAQHDLAVGDRVRVTHKRRPTEVYEGTVTRVGEYLHVGVDGGENGFHENYRWFDKWVPAVPTEGPVSNPFDPPAPAFAAPQVDEVFTRTYDDGRQARPDCTVTSVEPRNDGLPGWRVEYRAPHFSGTVLVSPHGELTNTSGWHPGAFIRPIQYAEAATPTPQLHHTGGWEVVTDLSTLRVGDTVRSTPDGIGGVLQATVTNVYGGSFNARTTHVLEETSNGRSEDLDCTYIYGDPGHNTLKWLGSGPAPDPAAREARLAAQAEAPLPDWATSLDAAKRHVHARARALYRSGENCAGGTSDFMEAAGLPRYDRDYPEPEVVDETAQIREFLATVREAANSTANRHGKDASLIRRWLEREGITPPPPVRHTIEIEVPHGVTLDMIRRQVRVTEGWRLI